MVVAQGVVAVRGRERNERKLHLKETESFNITQLRLAGKAGGSGQRLNKVCQAVSLLLSMFH